MAKKLRIITFIACIGWLAYWVVINVLSLSDTHRNIFTDSYSFLPLIAAVYVLVMAKQWGGFKSALGKSLVWFSVGLALQFCDQIIYSLYFFTTGKDLTFPNPGDIPYVLSGVAYVLAVYWLLKVIKPYGNRFAPYWVSTVSITIGALALGAMYVAFIQFGISDDRGLVYGVLNTLYPVLQAVYFVLGVVALLQSRLVSKGMLFMPVLLLLLALGAQFGADFLFLYQDYHETWIAAGTSDFLYATAYSLLVVAVYSIDRTRTKLLIQPAR